MTGTVGIHCHCSSGENLRSTGSARETTEAVGKSFLAWNDQRWYLALCLLSTIIWMCRFSLNGHISTDANPPPVFPGPFFERCLCHSLVPYFPIVSRGTLTSFMHWKWVGREPTMKFAFFAFLVFLGGAIFLLSFVADRQAKLGDDRVARKMSHSIIDARFVSERSPYMRNER
jgi:hypothetical protein